MLDGRRKDDPATRKMLPVEADVPKYLALLGLRKDATPLEQAVGDLALIAFYYLLRVGEYTTKRTRNESKQTVQFKLEDVTFFRKFLDELRCLPRDALDNIIMEAAGATL